MKKLFFAVLVASLTIFAGAATAESWSCEYEGSWQTNGTGNSGSLTWSTTWVKQGANWQIVGDMTDKYGSSSFNGSCSAKKCTMVQTYTSGSLVGKPYTYVGTYTDKWNGDSESQNSFRGTWTGNGNTGTWNAVAACEKN